jgi:predicted lipoprotein
MKKNIIWILCVVVLIVFLALNAKVIDKGTEGQYTGVVAFDASSSSSDDWSGILAEITANAEDIKDVDLRNLGAGKAVKLTGTVSEFVSKANGKKNSITVVPNNSTSGEVISIQLGSVYTGTSVRDIQTVKAFGDFTNQTEWSQYAKAINSQIHELVVEPLNIDESIQGKTVTVIGAATSSGDEVTVTPVSITIE